jgi:hypothetical protein
MTKNRLKGEKYVSPLLELELLWEQNHLREIFKAWDIAKPKLTAGIDMGKVIVFGTGENAEPVSQEQFMEYVKQFVSFYENCVSIIDENGEVKPMKPLRDSERKILEDCSKALTKRFRS